MANNTTKTKTSKKINWCTSWTNVVMVSKNTVINVHFLLWHNLCDEAKKTTKTWCASWTNVLVANNTGPIHFLLWRNLCTGESKWRPQAKQAHPMLPLNMRCKWKLAICMSRRTDQSGTSLVWCKARCFCKAAFKGHIFLQRSYFWRAI